MPVLFERESMSFITETQVIIEDRERGSKTVMRIADNSAGNLEIEISDETLVQPKVSII